MRVFERRTPWIAALSLAASVGASSFTPVLAQTVPPPPIDCGPVGVGFGDLVSLNVGNAGRGAQEPVVLHARWFNAEGTALVEQTLTLAPGQSRAVTLRPAEDGLFRGEIVPVSGPTEPGLSATVQVTRPRRLRLTYGPAFECAGPTASRGPV
jgi:hypothetical protein